MSCLKLLIVMVGLSTQVFAVNYSNQQLKDIINDEVDIVASEFVRGYYTAKNPQSYLNNFLYSNRSDTDVLIKEYKLYTLLNEIAQYPQMPFLQEAVNVLKEYEIQAYKRHKEGRIHIPVYDVRTKAQGIENIWLAEKSLNDYIHAFNHDPLQTIWSLKSNLQKMESPEWQGLKKSLDYISEDNHHKIRDFLLKNKKNMIGLDKFVSYFSLLNADKELVTAALSFVSKSECEYILRNLSRYFSDVFVMDTLFKSAKQKNIQKFAISMMAEHVNSSDEIVEFLFNSLSDKSLSSQAAFALSQAMKPFVIHKLYEKFYTSENSVEKKNIVFVLKMNKQYEAQMLLKQIENDQLDKSSQAWLNSFEEVVK